MRGCYSGQTELTIDGKTYDVFINKAIANCRDEIELEEVDAIWYDEIGIVKPTMQMDQVLDEYLCGLGSDDWKWESVGMDDDPFDYYDKVDYYRERGGMNYA